jgi:hypothetical protein
MMSRHRRTHNNNWAGSTTPVHVTCPGFLYQS